MGGGNKKTEETRKSCIFSFSNKYKMWCHVVMIQWTQEYTDDFIEQHFENDVKLKKRMPQLVVDWHWAKVI